MKTISIGIILYILLFLFGLIGYVKCIYKLTQCDFQPSYKAEVIYTIGVCTGLGAVIGWIDCGK